MNEISFEGFLAEWKLTAIKLFDIWMFERCCKSILPAKILVSYVYKYVGVLLASVFHLSKILWTYLLPVCIKFSFQ